MTSIAVTTSERVKSVFKHDLSRMNFGDLSTAKEITDLPPDVLAMILRELMVKDFTKVFLISKEWTDAWMDAAHNVSKKSLAVPISHMERARMLFPHVKIVPILEYWDASYIWLHNRNFNGFKEFLYYDPKHQDFRKMPPSVTDKFPSLHDTNSLYFPLEGFEHLWSEVIGGRKMLRVRKMD